MLNKIETPKILTDDLAYLCGVLAGDGSISFRESKGTYQLKCVGNPKNEKLFYFNILRPKFKRVFGFIPKIRYHDSKTTFGFVVYSKILINYLIEFIGLPKGRKYDSLRIPEIFLNNRELLINFIRGVFDTDGCITFKRRYKDYPYYPVISIASRSELFVKDMTNVLKKIGLKVVEIYNYKKKDDRVKLGYTIVSRIEINGKANLDFWMKNIGFLSPKHLKKINKYSM